MESFALGGRTFVDTSKSFVLRGGAFVDLESAPLGGRAFVDTSVNFALRGGAFMDTLESVALGGRGFVDALGRPWRQSLRGRCS